MRRTLKALCWLLDICSLLYIAYLATGLYLLERIPHLSEETRWLGCSQVRGWFISVNCRDTVFGQLIELVAESSEVAQIMLVLGLHLLSFGLLAPDMAPTINGLGDLILVLLALLQVGLLIWAFALLPRWLYRFWHRRRGPDTDQTP